MLLNRTESMVLLIDVQEKLTPFVADEKSFVKRCEWILKLAHKLGVEILVSEQYPKGLGYTLEQFHPFYVPELTIEKRCFSCMDEPAYVERLLSHNKKQMVLIGIETHVCVLQTAFGLLDKGYEVFVVVDAVSSRDNLDKKYALKRMQQQGAHLVTSEMVFFEWVHTSADPNFKALSKEFLQQG